MKDGGESSAGIPLTEPTAETLGTPALSVAHFNGALQHARRDRELEEQFEGEVASDRTLATQRGYVATCVTGSYACSWRRS